MTERLQAIYRPKGRAGEYASLAVNLYTGCTHGCVYCYAPTVLHKDPAGFHAQCIERPNILEKLHHDAKLLQGTSEPVLLCFSCDPYQPEAHATRAALSILNEFQIPFVVLTKGRMAWRDFDLYFPRDSFGMTLTCDNDPDSHDWEPKGADPSERVGLLRLAHEQGIRTWVSLEPVIYPEQTLRLIDATHEYVDHYKVGKLNYHPHAKTIDWPQFRADVIAKLEGYGKSYYIKQDLREAR
jgi:DNA repair photolyase